MPHLVRVASLSVGCSIVGKHPKTYIFKIFYVKAPQSNPDFKPHTLKSNTMASLLKISPALNKFKNGQCTFAMIISQGTFSTVGGILLITDQQVLLSLNSDIRNILQALKDADHDRHDGLYDIFPDYGSPQRVRNGNLELRFRIDRNSAADRLLGTHIGLRDMQCQIPWTPNGRSNDVDSCLQRLLLSFPMRADQLQLWIREVANFRQLAPH